jgi:hypothetical protein
VSAGMLTLSITIDIFTSIQLYALVCSQKKTSTEKPKVFGSAQIISLLNSEQNCGWVDLNHAYNPDLTCFTSSSVISVVEALMYCLMSMLYVAS